MSDECPTCGKVLMVAVLRAALRDACALAERWRDAAFDMAPESSMLADIDAETDAKLEAMKRLGDK